MKTLILEILPKPHQNPPAPPPNQTGGNSKEILNLNSSFEK